MADFCKCGSLIIRGNCSNKKCEHHKRELAEAATFDQIEYIKGLAKRLGNDQDELDFEIMSKKEASDLIDKLKAKIDSEE